MITPHFVPSFNVFCWSKIRKTVTGLCVCAFRSLALGALLTKFGTMPLGRIPAPCRHDLPVPWSLSHQPLPDVWSGGPELLMVPGDALCPAACPGFKNAHEYCKEKERKK